MTTGYKITGVVAFTLGSVIRPIETQPIIMPSFRSGGGKGLKWNWLQLEKRHQHMHGSRPNTTEPRAVEFEDGVQITDDVNERNTTTTTSHRPPLINTTRPWLHWRLLAATVADVCMDCCQLVRHFGKLWQQICPSLVIDCGCSSRPVWWRRPFWLLGTVWTTSQDTSANHDFDFLHYRNTLTYVIACQLTTTTTMQRFHIIQKLSSPDDQISNVYQGTKKQYKAMPRVRVRVSGVSKLRLGLDLL